MTMRTRSLASLQIAGIALVLLAMPVVGRPDPPVDAIDYQRDVRPLLSDTCYRCHGPDQQARQADLRLDLESGAVVELGGKAIGRQAPEKSLLLKRIFAEDPDDRMPPADSGKELTEVERNVIRRWIEQGAPWKTHWSYRQLSRPPVPTFAGDDAYSARHPVDAFVREKLAAEGVLPSRSADRSTLIRRVSLDLLGLPPSPEDVAAFVADTSPLAYGTLVDRLLASPHFGERLSMYWFDLVRFANSTGIHADNTWNVTAYRNWVIDAFNSDMPFDVFTRDQLGGDLLPQATRSQKVAAAYNRLNLITREGGSQAKEFLAKYTADRVRNASSVWLATTLGCAECHDHKFDPISTREFYEFGAFFADIEQMGVYLNGVPIPEAFPPYLAVPSLAEERHLEEFEAGISAADRVLITQTPELDRALAVWEEQVRAVADIRGVLGNWYAAGPFKARSVDAAHDTRFGPEEDVVGSVVGSVVRALDLTARYGGNNLGWVEKPEWEDRKIHKLKPRGNSITYLYRSVSVATPLEATFSLGSEDSLRVWVNDQEVLERKVRRRAAPDQEILRVRLREGQNHLLLKIVSNGVPGFYFEPLSVGLPEEIAEIVRTPKEARSTAQATALAAHYRVLSPLLDTARRKRSELISARAAFEKSLPSVIATVATEPMTVRVLPRGNWMDESGPIVRPGVPAALGSGAVFNEGNGGVNGTAGGAVATRLHLADWLVSGENPLTARVFANRLWFLFFGVGITKSLDDFGAQGESPVLPELLDWLAVEFMESGWDIRHLVRAIVTSETYQQSSAPRQSLVEKDPLNRLFARQSRWRLDAETVRDNALCVSGLLNTQLLGDHVAKPYQPTGYYRHLNFPAREYQTDENAGQYRRGVYMHWQRQFLHPALQAFDAPAREECIAQRTRSNTPQASLVLMNDPTFVEAARHFARELLHQPGTAEERMVSAVRRVLSRPPRPQELEVLRGLLAEQREHFRKQPDAAREFLSVGLRAPPGDVDPVELSAWTMLTRALLNLHEAITRY
jgi:hypothetical protein